MPRPPIGAVVGGIAGSWSCLCSVLVRRWCRNPMDGLSSLDNWTCSSILLWIASAVLLLVAVPVTVGGLVSWLIRRRFPSSWFVRSSMVVVVAIPIAWAVGMGVSRLLSGPSQASRGMFSLPVIDESRCTEVPPTVAAEIASKLSVGASNTVAWYEVKLEEAELVGPLGDGGHHTRIRTVGLLDRCQLHRSACLSNAGRETI